MLTNASFCARILNIKKRLGLNMFLTSQELAELTGYKYKSLQVKWLISHGYKFDVARDGRPKVLLSFIEHTLGGKKFERVSKIEPDLSDSRFFG